MPASPSSVGAGGGAQCVRLPPSVQATDAAAVAADAAIVAVGEEAGKVADVGTPAAARLACCSMYGSIAGGTGARRSSVCAVATCVPLGAAMAPCHSATTHSVPSRALASVSSSGCSGSEVDASSVVAGDASRSSTMPTTSDGSAKVASSSGASGRGRRTNRLAPAATGTVTGRRSRTATCAATEMSTGTNAAGAALPPRCSCATRLTLLPGARNMCADAPSVTSLKYTSNTASGERAVVLPLAAAAGTGLTTVVGSGAVARGATLRGGALVLLIGASNNPPPPALALCRPHACGVPSSSSFHTALSSAGRSCTRGVAIVTIGSMAARAVILVVVVPTYCR